MHELHPPPAPEMELVSPPGPLDTAENSESFFFAGFLHVGHIVDLLASLKEHLTSNILLQV